ncbi:hypothetical protein [Streptomyces tendae]|uniref:hypothetical protein n=1 Tax=Streptomyces tendae TaxID=1932 RepID=UPI003EBFC567
MMYTPYPPAVGDLIYLWDTGKREGGTYEVLARQWLHSSYGSTDWPAGEQRPLEGPLLDVVVQPAVGVFRDEAPVSDGEDGSQ